MQKFLLLSLSILFSISGFAQDFSNKGKDFWVGYGYHVNMFGSAIGGTQQMVLYFATDQVTTITITIPGVGYTQTLTSPAGNNVLTSAVIPKTGPQDAKLSVDGLSNRGIHITSDKPMVSYAHIYNASISGATILYPTNTLGKEYYSINYKNWSNATNSNCWFYVVATDTGSTRVEITPTGNTTGGWVAGTTYTVNLTQGQVYNVMGSLINSPANCAPVCTGYDLTGSSVKSVNTGAGCKKIAVFSGSGKLSITCNNNGASADNYMVQSVPKTAWGKKYLTVPASGNQSYNIYRICVSEPGTIVKVNGVVTALPLQIGFYYEIASTNLPQLIEADKPILVAQYFTSQGACLNGAPGDPEVIYLSPVEQNINTVIWNATPNSAITGHYINVVLPNTGTAISSFRLDGATVSPASFVVHPRDLGYSYLSQSVAPGQRIIQSDSGFNAVAYGFGNTESYGYNAGTNIKDLYQQIAVQTQYGIETTPSVCTGSPFNFKVSLPYVPDSMLWNFNGTTGMVPNNNSVLINNVGNVAEDSATVVNGKTIHWYSLPLFYNFTTAGVYPITIRVYVPNADCGSTQDIDFDLAVSGPPVASFSWVTGGCVAEPFQFTETTPQTPKATYSFWWSFGDPGSGVNNISTVRNPLHTFSAPGTYTVRFADITTPGCLSDTIERQVIVPALPSATITGTTSVCTNAPNPTITFTAFGGTAPYSFTYNVNAGASQTINTSIGNTVTIVVPTNTAGTYVYKLLSVKNTASALCTQMQTGSATVVVNPLPTAAIAGSITVCQNAASPLVTFTGAAGTAPYTFTYNINGGTAQSVTTVTGNAATVSVPTNTPGNFIYTLLTVRDGSSTVCTQPQTGTSTVIVRPLPTASIAGTVNVCLNAASPNVTFTGAGGTAPYTFTYNINAGASKTIVSTGSTATIAVPTLVAGSFVYNLLNVTEAGALTCTQAQSGSATVVVNPLPAATISGTTTVCLNSSAPFITFTGSGSTAPYSFTYNINGGAGILVTTTTGNTIDVAVPTNTAGTFVYNIVSVKDGSTTACSSIQTGSATVLVRQLATASIAGTRSICINSAAPNITFTGVSGTAPYTFSYNINGGATQTASTAVGNTVTVAVPTNTTGTFTYNLLAVREGSADACSQSQTGAATITVDALPTGSINGSAAVCLNAASPGIIFTGASGVAPYNFTYNINGGANQTVTTTSGNSISIPAPTNVAGTFTYSLLNVRESGLAACSQAQSGNAAVTVYPAPTMGFANTTPTCATRLVSFTDNSNPNAGTLTSWAWNFGDPASGTSNTSTLQNPSHIFSAAGNYTVSLNISTSNGCVNAVPFTRIVTINSRPLAGYIIPEVCLSDTYAQFLDSSKVANGSITGWNWNFGDANATVANPNTSFLKNPTHSYTAVGNYNVQLIATTNIGCKDTVTQVLAINGSFPVANFTVNNPATLCANDSVAIVNASTVFPGNITRIEIYWDNANSPAVFQTDDLPFAGKVYRHLYPNFQSPLTKTFIIRYRAYSGGVCVNDKISTVVVNAAPKVQFSAIPATCYDAAPFQLTQASETGAVPGSFVFSGPGVSPGGVFSPAIAGIGTSVIKYTYTSTVGGCVDTMSRTILVRDTATASFTFIAPACDGTAMTFTETSTAPPALVLTSTAWNFGDGSPIETHTPGSTFTHLFPAWGFYTVTMYNTSSAGCRSTSTTRQVFISPNPQPAFSFVQASVCLPNAVVSFVENSTIADGTMNALTYAWNFGDPASGLLNSSTAKNPPAHRFSGLGPYTVTLAVTSGSNCVRSVSRLVDFIHPQPKAAFDFNKPAVCIGDAVTFRDLTDGLDGTITQWAWNFGDATTSALQNPTHLYTGSLTYNVSLYTINSQGCNSDTLTKPFTVNPFPVVNAGPDKVVLENGSVMLQPVVTGNQLSYLWSPATYLNSVTSVGPTAINITGDITYRLTVTARGGCESFDELFIKVLKAPAIPNTFSPNGDGINEQWTIEYLDTYPDNRVQVFTRTGKLVFESRGYTTPWNGTINGNKLPVDTYYYIIEPGSGRKPLTGYVTILK